MHTHTHTHAHGLYIWTFLNIGSFSWSSIPWFPEVLCLVLRPQELSLFCSSKSINVLVVQLLFWKPCWWNCTSSLTLLEDTVSQQTSFGSQPSTPPLSPSFRYKSLSHRTCHHMISCSLHFWLLAVFCNGSHLLQREVSLLRAKDYTSLWV